MRMVINHLTRMQPPNICLAGIDSQTCRHVRPVPRTRQLTTALLASNGGPFDLAVEVDLDRATPRRTRPETEDHVFHPARVRAIRKLSGEEFWQLARRTAKGSLVEIFGSDLRKIGATSAGVDVKCGSASLGCLIPASPPRVFTRQRPEKPPQIRMSLTDGAFDLDLGVTDVRLFGPDLLHPDEARVADLDRRLAEGVEVVLSVGLTRAYQPSSQYPPVHWLQVNNVHLADQPAWRLA